MLADVLRPALARAGEGAGEALELASRPDGDTDLRIAITRLPAGKLVTVEDLRDARERDVATSALEALDRALALHEAVAQVRINLRGFVVRPGRSFLRMSGLGGEALARVRFVSLFDIASRVPLSDAIEEAVDRREPRRVAAGLLVGGTQVTRVGVALSPVTHAMAVTGLLAVLVTQPAH